MIEATVDAPVSALAPTTGALVVADRNPAILYLSSLARGSRPTMRGALRDLARFLGLGAPHSAAWHELRYQQTQAARTWVAERYAPATANRYLAALRGVLRQCFRLDLIDEHAYRRAVDVEPVRGSRELAGRSLSSGELRALFGACDLLLPLGARNAAMLALLYGGGLRRAEVVSLDLDDVDGNAVRVRRGKGNKSRRVFLPAGGIRALDAWLLIRGREPGPLLHPTHGGKPGVRGIHRRRMCADGVRLALVGLAQRAGVAGFSPHDVRRTFVGDLLDAGMDLRTVQELAGHSHVNTTARYDRRPERTRMRAAELLAIPLAG